MAELSQQNVAAHALALRQEASDAANLALQAQLTTAMAMIGDLRRRVDAGSAPATPRPAAASAGADNPLIAPAPPYFDNGAGVGDLGDDLDIGADGGWTQAEWEARDLYYDER